MSANHNVFTDERVFNSFLFDQNSRKFSIWSVWYKNSLGKVSRKTELKLL